MPDLWGIAAIVAKFGLYLGIFTAAGTVFTAVIFRLVRYRGVACGFACIGLVSALMSFFLQGAMLTGDASGLSDPEMLGLLWQTPSGTALMYRMAGLGLLIAGLFAGRIGLVGSANGGVLAIWSFNHIGHVAGQNALLLDLALMLHLLVAAFWIGILMPLRRLARSRETADVAASVGHRFGQIASVAVPILIVAGVYMGYVLVGSVSALFGAAYGQAIIIKLTLVGILLALAALNKLRFVPGLQAGDESAARKLAKAITFEWIIVLLILATTAVLTTSLTLPT
ncbi:putative copper resistance protein D [Litoreibacter meonggei]|uniref:Putative copper resistance protein D n=1 Tax=Litoreibacter meonggei TaxID=1049199 RepID=A0A497VPQ7_9RHOB|nr:CopD family protein [Litoreibacter meonggei]RLJ40924.1 putative copper resistance protein D [Litoreibacter meonggei]